MPIATTHIGPENPITTELPLELEDDDPSLVNSRWDSTRQIRSEPTTKLCHCSNDPRLLPRFENIIETYGMKAGTSSLSLLDATFSNQNHWDFGASHVR